MSKGGGSFSGSLSDVSKGVGGAFSDLFGGSASADAIGQAAGAQLGQQQADRTQAMGITNPTDQQTQQLQAAISANNQQIKSNQALLSSVDPALMEAGKQALDLMQGKSAASLDPIKNQRAQQRQQLQQQLAQQLGPDYATSTAGIQALNNFDQQTTNLMTNAQQSTIGQYLGSSQSSASLGTQGVNAGISQGQSINNTIGGNQGRQLSSLFGTPVDPGMGYQGQISQAASNQSMMGMFGADYLKGLGKSFGNFMGMGGSGGGDGSPGGGGNSNGGTGASPKVGGVAQMMMS